MNDLAANWRLGQARGRFLAIFGVLALAIVTSGGWYWHNAEYQYRAQVERQLSSISELKIKELVAWRAERLGDAQVFLGNAAFAALVRRFLASPPDPAAQAQLQDWLQHCQHSYHYSAICLMDTQGALRLAAENEQSVAFAQTHFGHEPAMGPAGEIVVEDLHRDAVDDQMHLSYLVPITEAAGSGSLGTLALYIDPRDQLYPFLARWPVPSQTAETLLVRQEGDQVVYLSHLQKRPAAAGQLHLPVTRTEVAAVKAVLGQQGVVEAVSYEGKPVLTYLHRVPGSTWFLTTQVDLAEAYAPLRAKANQVVLLIVVLILLAGVLTNLVFQRHLKASYRAQLAAEQARTEAEQRYRITLLGIGDGVIATDEANRVTFLNPAASALTGWRQEDAMGQPVAAVVGLLDAATQQPVAPPLGADPQPGLPAALLLRTRSGQLLPITVVAAPLCDQAGTRCGGVQIIHDQSAARAAEEMLRASEHRFRMVSALVSDCVYACRRATDGRDEIEWLVGAVEQTLGGAPADLPDLAALRALIAPEDVANWDQLVAQLLPGGAPGTCVLRICHGHGTVRWVEASVQCVDEGPAPPVRRLYGAIVDITARKRSEESNARLATAVEQSAEAIVVTDLNGTMVYVNPAYERITGHTAAEVIGQNARILKSGKHDAAFYRQMWAVLTAGQVWRGRLVNRSKEGAFFEEDVIISPVRDAAGTVVNYVACKRDLSRELQLEEQFHHSQKMEAVGQLAGGVAHDFNNMLAVICGYSELAMGQLRETDHLYAQLREIMSAGERASGLTRQLLAFSRRQVLEPSIIDLNQLVLNLDKMLRRLLRADITLTNVLADDIRPIKADPGQVEQVVMNLVVNARDAMQQGGSLTLATSNQVVDGIYISTHHEALPGAYVVLTVTDTGCGMSTAVLRRIFEPFFTTKEMGKGTGLGLATVYGIVTQSGGHVEVNSKVGEGTTFRVFLPQVAGAVVPAPQAAAPEDLPRGSETILLVEDEEKVRELTRRMLAGAGYQVLTAANGGDALHLLKQQTAPVHLLLTDVVMPGINGAQLAEYMQGLRQNLRVLFISGYTDEESGLAKIQSSRWRLVHKPFTQLALLRQVRAVLDDR